MNDKLYSGILKLIDRLPEKEKAKYTTLLVDRKINRTLLKLTEQVVKFAKYKGEQNNTNKLQSSKIEEIKKSLPKLPESITSNGLTLMGVG